MPEPNYTVIEVGLATIITIILAISNYYQHINVHKYKCFVGATLLNHVFSIINQRKQDIII